MHRLATLTLLLSSLTLVAPTGHAAPAPAPAPSTAPTCRGSHWVGAWAASPSDAGFTAEVGPARPLANQTLRMVVRPTLDGEKARIRLSHGYGDTPAEIGSATIARRLDGASAMPDTVRPLTFGGEPGVVLQPGAVATSDPVRLPVRRGEDLLVSLHLPGVVARPTGHFVTNTTNYLSVPGTGDHSAEADGTAYPLTTKVVFSMGWWFLAGVDVKAPRRTGAVVAFGDSITDGFQASSVPGVPVESEAGLDANARYPDFLSARLAAAGHDAGVLNAGISGNRVLADAEAPFPYGRSGLDRFRADVLDQPGVRDVVILEGINDLGNDEALPASSVIDGLRKLVRRAQRAGLRAHLGTLLPTGGAARTHGSEATQERRTTVNRWIRTQRLADSVIDFDRAVRDPEDPTRLRPEYDSGDALHPSSAGYRAMAGAVPLHVFRRGC